MSTITLQVPPSVTEAEARLCLAVKLYEVGRLSCGQAAELAGFTKPTFMELLGKHGAAVFDHPISELADDLSHA